MIFAYYDNERSSSTARRERTVEISPSAQKAGESCQDFDPENENAKEKVQTGAAVGA